MGESQLVADRESEQLLKCIRPDVGANTFENRSKIAYDEERILIANDLDFGELIIRYDVPQASMLLFRLGQADLPTMQQRPGYGLDEYAAFLSSLVIDTESGVRVRQPERCQMRVLCCVNG